MSDATAYRVHAATLPEGVRPGLWADTASKLLLMAAEQADEIERLTAEVERLKTEGPAEIQGAYLHGVEAGRAEMAAEVDRLRAAIKTIIDSYDDSDGGITTLDIESARDALNQQSTRTEPK